MGGGTWSGRGIKVGKEDWATLYRDWATREGLNLEMRILSRIISSQKKGKMKGL